MFRKYLLCLFFPGILLARQGTIITTDGRTLAGDILEAPDGQSVNITFSGSTATIAKSDVASIRYPADAYADFKQRLGALGPDDIKGRLDLSRAELDVRQFDLAIDAARDAERLDPHNPDAVILLDTIQSERALDAKASTRPSGADAEPPTTNHSGSPFLTMGDVYAIRRAELLPDDVVRVEFADKVRQRFLGAHANSAAFFAEPQTQQAMDILQTGDPNLAKDIHIASDPRVLLEFRGRVLPRLRAGCAASGCHGSTAAGSFFLNYDASPVLPAYTDFYILEKTGRKLAGGQEFGAGPVYRPMIDRLSPASSLMMQFGLPRALASTPHPDVRGFKPIFRDENDPVYLELLHWIDSMNPISSDYGIKFDLSAPHAAATQGF